MRSEELFLELKNNGMSFFTGVPDSVFANLVAAIKRDGGVRYVAATREEEAVGIATGAYLGGTRSAVHMENAGLGNAINALVSLVLLYRIPIYLVISWRGEDEEDTPEHQIQGEHTLGLLTELGIPSYALNDENYKASIAKAVQESERDRKPAAFLLIKSAIS